PRQTDLSARVDELTRTRRGALDVQSAELRRIERDLHDGAQARLVALTMQLGRAEARLEDRPETAELIRQAREEATAAVAELRDLARGIAPPVLADRGLVAAVEALAQRSGIDSTVESKLTQRLAPVVESAAYFVTAEALTNAVKHAPGASARIAIRRSGPRVVVETEDGEGLLRIVAGHKPDLAIVDVRLPPTFTDEGIRAALEARRRFPDLSVLVLSQYVEPIYTGELLASGESGVGYLLKERVGEVRTFLDAVHRVAGGGTALDREVIASLVRAQTSTGDDPLAELTPRERETLSLIAQGRTNAAIARELVITLGAVEKHVTNIFGKLNLPATDDDHRRVLAVLTYLGAGGLDASET